MTSGGETTEGFSKTRHVLGDVTNRLGKRGLLQISGNLGCKSGNRHGKHVDDREGDSQFTQKVCQGAENIVKEKCGIRCALDSSDKGKRTCVSPRPCSEINSLRGNIISGISKILSEAEETNSSGDSLHIGGSSDKSVEADGSPRDNFVCGISVPMSSRPSVDVEGNHDKAEGVTSEVISQGDELGAQVCRTDCTDIGADNFAFRKYDSVESSKPPESQGSGSFKLEKCTGLKGDRISNSSADVSLIKACSCSFCIKAAYIWSDLHYQDIKGRIAALKKSQKEANIMVERSCRDKGIDKHGQGKYQKYSTLESDLVYQWRSLFLHMEDILVREGSQLETSLLALKDLRESCKAELEMITGCLWRNHRYFATYDCKNVQSGQIC
ncbi:hypothetical protein NMG60_11007305 [Bertholletia excelsa]